MYESAFMVNAYTYVPIDMSLSTDPRDHLFIFLCSCLYVFPSLYPSIQLQGNGQSLSSPTTSKTHAGMIT